MKTRLKIPAKPSQLSKRKQILAAACDTQVAGTVTAGLDLLLREHVRLRQLLSAAELGASERLALEARQSEIEICYRERLKALKQPLAAPVPLKV